MIPSFAGTFLPKNKKRIIFNSTRNEYYNYNSKYLFEYFIKNHPEFECKFVINDGKKRKELNEKFGKENNYFIETESLRGILYALSAKLWVTSALETPVGGLFQKINRRVFHLGHGAYFRSALFLEKKLPWHKRLYYHIVKNNFSHHLITSEAIAKIAPKMFGCKPEQIVIAGEPMNDMLFNPKELLLKSIFGKDILEHQNILYAPTWRQDGSLKLFPFDDMDWDNLVAFLEENNINIFLRLHPSYEEDLTFYTEKTDKIKILDSSTVEDINEVIGLFDMIVTDYSSIFAGYLMLGKPLLFLPYDFEKYNSTIGFVLPYEEAAAGPKPKSYEAFKNEVIKLFQDETYYHEERTKANALFNDTTKRDNSKHLVKYITENML